MLPCAGLSSTRVWSPRQTSDTCGHKLSFMFDNDIVLCPSQFYQTTLEDRYLCLQLVSNKTLFYYQSSRLWTGKKRPQVTFATRSRRTASSTRLLWTVSVLDCVLLDGREVKRAIVYSDTTPTCWYLGITHSLGLQIHFDINEKANMKILLGMLNCPYVNVLEAYCVWLWAIDMLLFTRSWLWYLSWIYLYMSTVLAGGASGFIGSALRSSLTRKGHEVIAVSRRPAPGAVTWVRQDGMTAKQSAVQELPVCPIQWIWIFTARTQWERLVYHCVMVLSIWQENLLWAQIWEGETTWYSLINLYTAMIRSHEALVFHVLN